MEDEGAGSPLVWGICGVPQRRRLDRFQWQSTEWRHELAVGQDAVQEPTAPVEAEEDAASPVVDVFINITSEVFHCHAVGKKSP